MAVFFVSLAALRDARREVRACTCLDLPCARAITNCNSRSTARDFDRSQPAWDCARRVRSGLPPNMALLRTRHRCRDCCEALALPLKKTLLASETDRADIVRARHVWHTHRQPWMMKHPERLVFIDETGTTTKMTRLRGRARRGQRLKMKVPFGHWGTQTFIAALRHDGLTAPWVIDRPMNRKIFEAYVETQLAPTLKKGDMVILDNLSSHKSEKAAAILKARGAWFL